MLEGTRKVQIIKTFRRLENFQKCSQEDQTRIFQHKNPENCG